MQSICDLRVSANTRGLTSPEAVIAESIYDTIPQYRYAARILASGEIYTRTAPQSHKYRELSANHGAAYTWENNELITIAHDTPVYRMRQMVRAYADYKAGRIHPGIWDNYSHGGYMTRRGLYANYNDFAIERIKRIAESHTECTIDGQAGHDMRVAMRN